MLSVGDVASGCRVPEIRRSHPDRFMPSIQRVFGGSQVIDRFTRDEFDRGSPGDRSLCDVSITRSWSLQSECRITSYLSAYSETFSGTNAEREKHGGSRGAP